MFTWRHFIICFNKICQNVLFCPLDYIAVASIQVEKPRGNPHEKYRGVPKGGVIKGMCKYSYQRYKNPVFNNKYIINVFTCWWVLLSVIYTCCWVIYLWYIPLGESFYLFHLPVVSPSICDNYLLVSPFLSLKFTCWWVLLFVKYTCWWVPLPVIFTCWWILLSVTFTCWWVPLSVTITCWWVPLPVIFTCWWVLLPVKFTCWWVPLPVTFTCWWVPFTCDIHLLVSSLYLWHLPVGEFLLPVIYTCWWVPLSETSGSSRTCGGQSKPPSSGWRLRPLARGWYRMPRCECYCSVSPAPSSGVGSEGPCLLSPDSCSHSHGLYSVLVAPFSLTQCLYSSKQISLIIWINFNLRYLKILCARVKITFKRSQCIFTIIPLEKGHCPLLNKINSFCPRMLCAKFEINPGV